MCDLLFKIDNVTFNNLYYKDLSIPKNKINFITGESGAGKSTLLKLLNNTISADSGDIFYNGRLISEIDPIELRKNTSLVSQEIFLFNETIEENFRQFYALRNLDCPSSQDIKDIINFCCLDLPLDKHVSTLSGGEKQRLYISIFLSFKPEVLMLDEPTSALDRDNSHKLMSNIISFCKSSNTNLIVISHDKDIVDTFCENKIQIIKENTL